MEPLGDWRTTRPFQTDWELTIEPYPSGRYRCIDDQDCHFGTGSVWTRTRTQSDDPEPLLTVSQSRSTSFRKASFTPTSDIGSIATSLLSAWPGSPQPGKLDMLLHACSQWRHILIQNRVRITERRDQGCASFKSHSVKPYPLLPLCFQQAKILYYQHSVINLYQQSWIYCYRCNQSDPYQHSQTYHYLLAPTKSRVTTTGKAKSDAASLFPANPDDGMSE
jgi:hypothetical protein